MDDHECTSPIAIRDFPEDCWPGPKRALPNPRLRLPTALSGGVTELEGDTLDLRLPSNFHELSPREQFLERRGLFSRLMRFYQQDKELRRPDLAAMKRMNRDGSSFNFEGLGPVPGVEETDVFVYRSEALVVGLHRQVQRGIAYVPYQGETVASSVVISGGYTDDVDKGNLIEYTGQGGNDYRGDKRQLEDQTLQIGNKALITSCKLGTPVRVIRGRDKRNSQIKEYSYGGLFQVTNQKREAGRDGHKVYKFTLREIEPSEGYEETERDNMGRSQ